MGLIKRTLLPAPSACAALRGTGSFREPPMTPGMPGEGYFAQAIDYLDGVEASK